MLVQSTSGTKENHGTNTAASSNDRPGHDERSPLEEHQQSVPAVDKLPKAVWVVAVAGAAERFAYYALSAPLRKRYSPKSPAPGLFRSSAGKLSPRD